MNVEELEIKWNKIYLPKSGSYAYNRINGVCLPELNIGVSEKGNRCLILVLPPNSKIEFVGEKKENLETYFRKKEKHIVLELTDRFYNSFFVDLVVSLYYRIKDISDENDSARSFISLIQYWSDFLRAKKGGLLSAEAVKGMYGELTYLEYLLGDLDLPINDILNSWKGPYDDNHDFHFDEKNAEIKTKTIASNEVHISSEYQLEAVKGKKLELVAISVEDVAVNGDNLSSVLNRIRKYVLHENGDISIISAALLKKNIQFSTVDLYDSYMFRLKTFEVFNCDDADFPKLTSTNIGDNLRKVSYRLILKDLDNKLLIKTINF
jgi:hypothetical protein|tara:strand:+ start:1050 stop:2015 length:966 start_codon:yes stop_codon:yes gene_type:complete